MHLTMSLKPTPISLTQLTAAPPDVHLTSFTLTSANTNPNGLDPPSMASCDDDFSLLGDDNATTSHPSNPNPNLIHHRQSFAPRNISAVNDDDDDVVSADADGYSDGAFCSSQPNNPKLNNANINTTSYHVVDVNPYDSDQNPFDHDHDLNKSRTNINNNNHEPNEKRTDREEVSDSGTPYSYKRARVSSSATGPGGGEYRKDREEWSDTAIACLLEAYTEKFMMLNRGNLRGRDWEDVAAMVSERCEKQSKSVEQCKNKVDNLKKRYKLERHRLSNGGVSASHWPWFKQMEQIVGNSSSSVKGAADDEKSVGGSANSGRQSKRYGTTAASPAGLITNIKSKSTTSIRWRRVVFKISGATLSGTSPQNVDPKVALLIAREVSIACRLGVEVAVVVGARNFFCGHTLVATTDLDRFSAYQIGMMATVMNALLLQSALQQLGVQTRVQSAYSMPNVAEPYCRLRAIRHLEKGRVVIFGGIGGGAGNLLFSTDFAAALRASEIHAEAVVKGTNADGVFVCDSRNNNVTADRISFAELISGGTGPMDAMALRSCQENAIPVVVFNLHEPGNITRALCGQEVGTLIDQTGGMS